MDFPSLGGLPAHPLIVHATIVLVPLAALAVVLHAWWPAARARLGYVTVALAALAMLLTPLAASSGEQLQKRVEDTDLVRRHAELGDQLVLFVVALLVVALILAARDFFSHRNDTSTTQASAQGKARAIALLLARRTGLIVGILATLLAVGTTVQVIRIGHAGAESVWHDTPTTDLPGSHQRPDSD